jgi:hypothetical protein
MKQPDLSKLLRGDFRLVSVEKLMRILTAFAQDVEITLRPHRNRGEVGRITFISAATCQSAPIGCFKCPLWHRAPWRRHAIAHQDHFALRTGVPDDGSRIIGKHAGHRCKVADIAVHRANGRVDGLLVGRDRIEITHRDYHHVSCGLNFGQFLWCIVSGLYYTLR